MPRRRLRPSEIREAESVFGGELDYAAIWVHEGVAWPNWLASLGSVFHRRTRPRGMNAVTLGEHVYFPVFLHTEPSHLEDGLYGDMGWLIHELTHVWQYRLSGVRSLARAIGVHFKSGPAAYDYGGADGLQAASLRNASLADFNPEQQGDVLRDYYLRKRMKLPTDEWTPFVTELRGVAGP